MVIHSVSRSLYATGWICRRCNGLSGYGYHSKSRCSEICDGQDNNCDGLSDDAIDIVDQ